MKSLDVLFGRRSNPAVIGMLAGMALLVVSLQVGSQTAVDPAINAPYADPDIGYWRGVFENERREIYAHRFEILNALELQPGMAVADVGTGTGFFALMFAETVGPAGRVYAVDISPQFVSAVEERAASAGLTNIIGIVNEPRDVRLPPGSVDVAFISDTYHHFEYPGETLNTLHTALKPGGSVVIVDFRRVPGLSSPWVMGHVRAGANTVRAELESAGFEFLEQRDFMRTQYYMRFRKAELPVATR